MTDLRRTVTVALGDARFKGAVPRRAAVAFDARGERWLVTHESVADAPRPAGAPSAPDERPVAPQPTPGVDDRVPRLPASPASHLARAILMGLLGGLLGLAVGAIVYQYGPQVSASASGPTVERIAHRDRAVGVADLPPARLPLASPSPAGDDSRGKAADGSSALPRPGAPTARSSAALLSMATSSTGFERALLPAVARMIVAARGPTCERGGGREPAAGVGAGDRRRAASRPSAAACVANDDHD